MRKVLMATKLTRAEKRARNKERWSQGERWESNGNGKNGSEPDSPPELENGATPARDNRWQSAPNGAHRGHAAELVYGLSAAGERATARLGARARLALAQQADTPSEAVALAAPFAPPCRCCRPLPEARNGYLWLGYRFSMCCKCGHDVLGG